MQALYLGIFIQSLILLAAFTLIRILMNTYRQSPRPSGFEVRLGILWALIIALVVLGFGSFSLFEFRMSYALFILGILILFIVHRFFQKSSYLSTAKALLIALIVTPLAWFLLMETFSALLRPIALFLRSL